MYYCDECAKKKGYPETIAKSGGVCEICGRGAICNNGKVKKFNDEVLRTKRVAVIVIDKCENCEDYMGCKYPRPDGSIPEDCPLNSEEVPYSNDFDNPERQIVILNYSEKNEINKKYGIKND